MDWHREEADEAPDAAIAPDVAQTDAGAPAAMRKRKKRLRA